jgi:subtilisin family serine protease
LLILVETNNKLDLLPLNSPNLFLTEPIEFFFNMKFFLKSALFLVLALTLNTTDAQNKAPENWFNLDPVLDKVNGTGGDLALQQLKAKGKKPQTVIVAVLDSGVDYKHEDLKDVMWVNPGEIPGNGKDDDNNGYVDDIHGWNFIGGKDGQNVHHDSYELTREYARLSKKFGDADPSKLSKADQKAYAEYEKIKIAFEEKRGELEAQKNQMDGQFVMIALAFGKIQEHLRNKNFTADDLTNLDTGDNSELKQALEMTKGLMAQGVTPQNLDEQKAKASEFFNGGLTYGYNTEYNPRTVIGDDYNDLTNRAYGNNDYRGPDASHGTHVAGIIAAKRNNNIGMNGVSENTRIMTVRCVPDGDERDKDVANAIYYAVDNGASIINMSFGKGYSPNKDYVDAAMQYAADHDVLLVHAAGNDSEDNDTSPNYPNDELIQPLKKGMFKKVKNVESWMEIGALNWRTAEKRTANFSNYGKKNVDLFSPGVAIYSTVPDNKYASFQGTSMAAPAAAGVAAILRSYFPDLSAKQVKSILESSVVKMDGEVNKPGTTMKVKFADICASGGIISAPNAAAAAEKTAPRKSKNAIWREAGEGKAVKLKGSPKA